MTACQSSALEAYGYDEETQTLFIRVIGGKTFRYHDVPLWCYEQLRDAKSKGSYYGLFIKKVFGNAKAPHP